MSHNERLKRSPDAFRQLTGLTPDKFDLLLADLAPRYLDAGFRRVPPTPAAQPFHRAYPPGLDRLVVDEALQVLGHLVGRLVAPLRILVDRLHHDRFQIQRNPRIERARAGRLRLPDQLDQL